nr:monodehydroascorbate reductase [Tanacetum cinerariifolium]GEX62877.1 monodehydroascorbate reductase [Tanacetum cinerariifolium]
MADVNVNAPADQAPTMAPPTRTIDLILPHIRWVPIGKRNCYLDVEKSQSNPIYKIAVDILKHTNFFRAFTASLTISSIYIHDALQITPINNNKAFSSLPSSDALINFFNDLGYPKVIKKLSNVVDNDMFQPWRALTTIINLCLTGKTLGFERPRVPVFQILWGIVNRAHIDYAERIWEEFTQSIHTFIEDKKNLAQHTHGKKKATLIVISRIRFTKLIIYYLQWKHKFHPRPDSPLHLPNEEPVLGYIKFSAKGTKREVFRMPIPGNLITIDIQGEPYYQEYLENVVKHQRYLAGEQGSDPDSPALKPAKATKKSNPSAPKADLRPPGPLLPVAIREPVSRKYQLLPEVHEKGKEKVTNEQVALNLLTLRASKKKNPAEHFIFQMRTSTPTRSSSHDESSSLYVELGLIDSEVESDKDVPGMDAGVQDEGQARPNPGEQDEGQTGPNPVMLQQADNEKTTAEIEAESMVSVTIQQDASSIPPMTTSIIDLTSRPDSPNRIGELEHIMANLIQDNKHLEERLDSHGARLYALENIDIPHQMSKAVDEIVTDAVDWAIQAPLWNRFRDLPEAYMKEILHQRM